MLLNVPKEGFSGVFSWIHSLFLCLLTLALPAQNFYLWNCMLLIIPLYKISATIINCIY